MNTCDNLLGDIVPLENARELVAGQGWEDPDSNIKLNSHLGSQAAEIFRRYVESLNMILQELSKELGFSENFEICYYSVSSCLQRYSSVLPTN